MDLTQLDMLPVSAVVALIAIGLFVYINLFTRRDLLVGSRHWWVHLTALIAWVLGEAIRQQAVWREAGHDIRIAVNVSPAEASGESFLPMLKRLLGEAGVSGRGIELEITEGLLLDPDKPSVQALFQACEDEGIHLAIDDFGIGYSSLNYLANLPISKIKIDRSFIGRMDRPRHGTLVRTAVSLGRDLEKRVVAEGVEEETQLQASRGMGCDAAQGYFLCRPVPAERIRILLQAETRAARQKQSWLSSPIARCS